VDDIGLAIFSKHSKVKVECAQIIIITFFPVDNADDDLVLLSEGRGGKETFSMTTSGK
jgi:hypothetical protein